MWDSGSIGEALLTVSAPRQRILIEYVSHKPKPARAVRLRKFSAARSQQQSLRLCTSAKQSHHGGLERIVPGLLVHSTLIICLPSQPDRNSNEQKTRLETRYQMPSDRVLGKRKRTPAEKAKKAGHDTDAASMEDAQAIFRRHFEAQFAPLVEETKAPGEGGEGDKTKADADEDVDGMEDMRSGSESGDDDEWGGLSGEDDTAGTQNPYECLFPLFFSRTMC